MIAPTLVRHGVPRYDFRQVVAARTLADLAAAGVSTRRLRRSLRQLRRWMPEADRPLEQLAILESSGQLLVRLEAGELAQPDGQLQLDYEHPRHAALEDDEEPAAPAQLRLVPGPRDAADWHEQGVDQERHGLLAEAERSYRQALLEGGPDPQVAFDLASILGQQGKRHAAIERYRLVIEIDPRRGDAWNNLGILLAEANETDEAVAALREALGLDPQDPMARYNLADTLDAAGRAREAAEHWRAYLRLAGGAGAWSEHASRRLRAGGGRAP